jgi:cytochrome P450
MEYPMTVEASISSNTANRWDPYDPAIMLNPYPAFRHFREEMPLYYNEQHDFYALSRWSDVERGLADHETFISGFGGLLEFIKGGIEMPRGLFIFEDDPVHALHRGIVSRVFTPKKMEALEAKIRAFTVSCLDPFVGEKGFDFVTDLGAIMPMRVIGMLLGIPETETEAVRQQVDATMRTEEGQALDSEIAYRGECIGDYIEWRWKNLSDDLTSQLITAEIVDETGTKRHLTHDEILAFATVLVGAGNETTNRMLGWAGKVFADHPDQRRQLAKNPNMIGVAVEELLRYESPTPHLARYVTRDVEYYGQTVPKGSAMILLAGSANRDESRFAAGDAFNINREKRPHMTFGHGIHTCLGAALTRVEGRIALEEVLKRFPEWQVDEKNAAMASSSSTRGWDTLPVLF